MRTIRSQQPLRPQMPVFPDARVHKCKPPALDHQREATTVTPITADWARINLPASTCRVVAEVQYKMVLMVGFYLD
ncbi:MAG: hypothetical protein ACPHL6_02080 [Rubripirellula sp.]